MASVEEILKKLNRVKLKNDEAPHIGILGDKKIIRGSLSTGSPYLDYLLGGGLTRGGYNTIVGSGGAGKSSISLMACKDAISKGLKAVYYDGEYTMDESYFTRMNVDKHKLVLEQGRNLEEMLDFIEQMSTADDVGVIIIDSIPVFYATAVEAKSAGDNHIGIEAKRFQTRMTIIEGNCARRGIALIGLTSYRLNPNAMGDPRVLPRGEWQKTMNNVFLDITKKDIILNKDKVAIGHKLDVRIKKTKTNTYNPKHVFTLDFFYDGGFNKDREYVSLFLEHELIQKSGAWINFEDQNGEEVKVQGKEAAVQYFLNDKECFDGYKRMLDNKFSNEMLEKSLDETEGLKDFKEDKTIEKIK